MDWPPMRVVWSVTQVSSFGALASGGVFASAFASAAGLESLDGSCAEVGREVSPSNRNPNIHMVNSFFISAPVDWWWPQLSPQDFTQHGKDKSNSWRAGRGGKDVT